MDREERRFVSRKFTIEAKTVSFAVEPGREHLVLADMEIAVAASLREMASVE